MRKSDILHCYIEDISAQQRTIDRRISVTVDGLERSTQERISKLVVRAEKQVEHFRNLSNEQEYHFNRAADSWDAQFTDLSEEARTARRAQTANMLAVLIGAAAMVVTVLTGALR